MSASASVSTPASVSLPDAGGRSLVTHTSGYPRIGAKRELKKAVEAYWQGKLPRAGLESMVRDLRKTHWLAQRDAGISLIPSNDFSFYDQVLDLSCLVGNVPPRFGEVDGNVDLDTFFAIARGVRGGGESGHVGRCGCDACAGGDADGGTFASEMTKWFDTNYHYIVPEFGAATRFRLASSKPFVEFAEALALGIKTKPVFVGPVTYLALGKVNAQGGAGAGPGAGEFDRFSLLDGLVEVYAEVLRKLAALGAEWVQLDEPVFALDLAATQRAALERAYARLAEVAGEAGVKLIVATYFGGLRDNLRDFLRLPVAVLHIDLVRAPRELDTVLRELPAGRCLSLGVVDGRNIWRTDFDAVLPLIGKAVDLIGAERVWLAPSCSLLHVPVSLRPETKLDAELLGWLAFAEEKLVELAALGELAAGQGSVSDRTRALFEQNQRVAKMRRASTRIHQPEVKARLASVKAADLARVSPFAVRQTAQRERLRLPLFPTTTIGSFPQTAEVRAARARWRRGEWSGTNYREFIECEIAACVRWQEEIGIDVLVHGEFERNDMVEYFGEQLRGYAFTANGWVQSYGTRCVKPPVIYGDVTRPAPMTVGWASYAQSLTKLPIKGMLTGPVTMLQWSFVRDDQSRRDTAWQIALALRDEVLDLERAGIAVIQIDEPALREGLPLRRDDWKNYLEWAVGAFRLCAAGVRGDTQIHTHMCYSEFNDIIDGIAALDADVITIETSRSNMELLGAFVDFRYPAEIGPGVYDIHSPRVPAVAGMEALLRKACEVIPPGNLWVNPDCGLKTRGWTEVRPSLENMVACARALRAGAHPGRR
ncbi:5-methyltetrahydropteroyltriglutamate--homocysteine S-methyltransferase [Opitutaceae bacterium TAV4]|nr:5-methyltetrahydropteroyltriglutamate--homocysteine S-methyltransferase [Opitutaceae bacterium TAV4]RRK02321.1 5-methyltetrahydropteroyltriglutamate--homocysteine S-methyltransferase [Opitutaceae bacterium TAV3]